MLVCRPQRDKHFRHSSNLQKVLVSGTRVKKGENTSNSRNGLRLLNNSCSTAQLKFVKDLMLSTGTGTYEKLIDRRRES